MNRRYLLLAPTVFVTTVLVLAGAAILLAGRADNSAQAQQAESASGCANADWAGGEVARLKDGKKKAKADKPEAVEIANLREFAYPSRPVQLGADGEYTFEFGPLDSSFPWSTELGPSDAGFTFSAQAGFKGRFSLPTAPPAIVEVGGQRFYQVRLNVAGIPAGQRCADFVLVMY